VSNSTTNGTHKPKKSEDKTARRQSLFLGENNDDSVSSTSSESSSPTTPEPSQLPYVVNGRLGVPTNIPKIKTQSLNSKSSTTKSTTTQPVTRRSNTAPVKPRPKSTIGDMYNDPSSMLKKQATKRMSMIIESGR